MSVLTISARYNRNDLCLTHIASCYKTLLFVAVITVQKSVLTVAITIMKSYV